MRPVTLLSLAVAALLGMGLPAVAAPSEKPPAAASAPATDADGADQPTAQEMAGPAARQGAAARTSDRSSEKRRRRTYASCNRESHRSNLSGGARRRFLIRCRLGYERRGATPSTPARRP